jgi:TrkA domain protein
MTVYESDLPGVGKKFEVELDDGRRLVVVIHNTGKRELFVREHPDADAEKLFELSDRLARQVGTIMEGAYFQPIRTERIETVLEDDTVIEWVKVPDDSPLVGQTLADAQLRQRAGASIVAINREDEETVTGPEGSTEILAGDTLVVMGSRESCGTLVDLVQGEADVEADDGSLEEGDEGGDEEPLANEEEPLEDDGDGSGAA